MGAKSTVDIRREHAIEIIEYLLTIAGDRGIADALEALTDDLDDSGKVSGLGCSNFSIDPNANESTYYWVLSDARRHKEENS